MTPELISALITIIICSIIGILPTIIIAVLIIKTVREKNKQNASLMDKAMELHREKEEKENPGGINAKRIVRCMYCGRQTRFNNGKCPNCGAELKYE